MVDARSRRYRQFGLAVLFAVVTAACAWAAIAHYFGLLFAILLTVLLVVLLALAAIWACAYVHVPELTKVVTLLGALGGTLLLTLVCLLVHARETARRNQCLYNLQRWGEERLQHEMLHPGEN